MCAHVSPPPLWTGERVFLLDERPLLLRAGDVLVMDTKVWHYGGENTSRRERFLLQFSFLGAQCAGGGAPPRPRGFTYHLDGSLRGMRLGDFGA